MITRFASPLRRVEGAHLLVAIRPCPWWVGGALVLTLAAAMAACSDASGPVPVGRVQIEPASAERVVGTPVQLRATTYDADGKALTDRAVTWTSSHPSVAAVNADGLVSTMTPGLAVVTAASEGQAGSATITVIPVPVASVDVTPTAAEILPGETVQLQAVARDSAGGPLTGRPTLWTSSVPAIAQVDANGLVTGVAPGSVVVTAASEGRAGSATITVAVPPDPCVLDNARPIALGSTTNGSLLPTDCRMNDGSYYDLYQFTLTTPATVRIDLTSTAFDAFLILAQGTMGIAYDDDSGGNGNARIIRPLAAGRYLIVANSFGAGETGPYQLTLAAVSGASLDANAVAEPAQGKPGALRKQFLPPPGGSR